MYVFSCIETPPENTKKKKTLTPTLGTKEEKDEEEADIFITALWVCSGSLYFGPF